MPKLVAALLGIILLVAALIAPPLLRPARVLAASGILTLATPLHDAPTPDATVLVLLPAGAVVVIDGPPVDGFYPVTAGDLTGWMLGETLLLEKDQVAAGAMSEPAALAPDPALGPPPTAATEPEPVLDPAAATPVPVDAVGELPLVDAGVVAPVPAVDATVEPFPGAGPRGSASVTAETPILLGPGSEFGLIATAPAGSTVEQTGHLIDGYVTVQYAGITGWARLDHLGPPAPAASEMPTETVDKKQARRDRS